MHRAGRRKRRRTAAARAVALTAPPLTLSGAGSIFSSALTLSGFTTASKPTSCGRSKRSASRFSATCTLPDSEAMSSSGALVRSHGNHCSSFSVALPEAAESRTGTVSSMRAAASANGESPTAPFAPAMCTCFSLSVTRAACAEIFHGSAASFTAALDWIRSMRACQGGPICTSALAETRPSADSIASRFGTLRRAMSSACARSTASSSRRARPRAAPACPWRSPDCRRSPRNRLRSRCARRCAAWARTRAAGMSASTRRASSSMRARADRSVFRPGLRRRAAATSRSPRSA